jgi:hypothetical protein
MFIVRGLDIASDIFSKLSDGIEFEEVVKGRKAAILVKDLEIIPICRSTTIYHKPARQFLQSHHQIIDMIKHEMKTDIDFNNAMIEIYDSQYKTMGYHSDQALDLADGSMICIFSCYNSDKPKDIRTLKIKEKDTPEIFSIQLAHNSIIMFDTNTNSKYLHKIILETNKSSDDMWLGITFRLSKTFIRFIDEIPYFLNGMELVLADSEQIIEYHKQRGLENKTIGYVWPDEITYTISQSDLLKPIA